MNICSLFLTKTRLMARRKKQRLIQRAPNFGGFMPFGVQHSQGTEVVLSYEEYEAFTLCDYESMTHAEAALLMEVSRPTFTRIYSGARQKLAKALVEAATIRIEGGHVLMATRWYRCSSCQIDFNIDGEAAVGSCPLCRTECVTLNI
jgi:predicted DNA-binding protein (UPF0251 family)